MSSGIDATTIERSGVNRFALAMERTGFAIMGALCGLFVAALVAKANIEEINSLGVVFSVVLYGAIGFYLGTDLPSLSRGASSDVFSGTGSKTNPIALASVTGTLLATVAARVSVYMIVSNEAAPFIWNVGIGSGWMIGVMLQLAAGTAARFGQ
jgi:hypothetical protein